LGRDSNEIPKLPLSVESLDSILERIAQLLVDEGKSRQSDSLSKDQAEAVACMRADTVQELFTIAMLVQSTASRQVRSADVDGRVEEVIAELDATIRSVQRDAFEQLGPFASAGVPGDQTRKDKPRFGMIPQRKRRMAPRVPGLDRQDEQECTWIGDVTWREVTGLREELFDQLEVPGSIGVRLDVRGVTSIDSPGIALLIGANYRATAVGRRLVVIDADGPVTAALSRRHVIRDFLVTQVFTGESTAEREGPSSANPALTRAARRR
jgi:ABC-type transporter Mla MlaB component